MNRKGGVSGVVLTSENRSCAILRARSPENNLWILPAGWKTETPAVSHPALDNASGVAHRPHRPYDETASQQKGVDSSKKKKEATSRHASP